jgi:drug/metabolite transporter superfamily protein YnfA
VLPQVRPTANVLVICTTLVACTILGVYGFLGVHNKNTADLLQLLGTVMTLLSLLWNNVLTKNSADKQDAIGAQVDHLAVDIPAKITEVVAPVIGAADKQPAEPP